MNLPSATRFPPAKVRCSLPWNRPRIPSSRRIVWSLVIGRIGALLAQKLHALDARVTVSARSPRDFARIETQGMQTMDTRHLAGQLAGFGHHFQHGTRTGARRCGAWLD